MEFDIVNVPEGKLVLLFTDCIIAWLKEMIELIIRFVLRVDPLAVITAEPTVSPTAKVEIANDPPSEVNKAVSISGSFGSWLTFIVKSVKLSQSVFESITPTVGLKAIQIVKLRVAILSQPLEFVVK